MENSDFKVGKSNIKVGMVEFLTLMSEIPNFSLVFKDYFIGDPIRLPYWTKIYDMYAMYERFRNTLDWLCTYMGACEYPQPPVAIFPTPWHSTRALNNDFINQEINYHHNISHGFAIHLTLFVILLTLYFRKLLINKSIIRHCWWPSQRAQA